MDTTWILFAGIAILLVPMSKIVGLTITFRRPETAEQIVEKSLLEVLK